MIEAERRVYYFQDTMLPQVLPWHASSSLATPIGTRVPSRPRMEQNGTQ